MATRSTCEQEIRYLELQIQDWRRTQSQSNPSAVFELRDMKKELAKYQKLRNEFVQEENTYYFQMMLTCPIKSICSLCEPNAYKVVPKPHRCHAKRIEEYLARAKVEPKEELLNELEGLIRDARTSLQEVGGCPSCVNDTISFEEWFDQLEYAQATLDVYAYLYQYIHKLPFPP